MTALKAQGTLFSAFAIVLSAATLFVPPFNERAQLIVLALLIVLLGVPHGALDTIFARNLYEVRSVRRWALFALAYLAPVLLVIALWKAAPILFLLGFLTISLVHFSGDPTAGTPWPVRILYGGLIIFLPTLLHSAEVTTLFSLLVGDAQAASVVPPLRILGWLWLAGVPVTLVICLRSANRQTALEIIAVALLATLTSPLLAFSLFFCGMHSARHILRTIEYSGQSSPRLLAAACLVPMITFLTLFGAAYAWLRPLPLETRLVQLIFVALAALTVPHMALVERVRFSGWARRTISSTSPSTRETLSHRS